MLNRLKKIPNWFFDFRQNVFGILSEELHRKVLEQKDIERLTQEESSGGSLTVVDFDSSMDVELAVKAPGSRKV